MNQQRVFQAQEGIIWKTVQGEVVLLNPENGQYFGLNASGSSFWEKLDGRQTVGEIVSAMESEYAVDQVELLRDIEELVETLLEKGLIHIVA